MLTSRKTEIARAGVRALCFGALTLGTFPAAAQTVMVYQGAQWTAERRDAFYTQDQGSRLMPIAWMRALKQSDGNAFLSDSLERYGYLPNPTGGEADLPVGFTVADGPNGRIVGMTCSACHTRQIEVGGTAYRIDGGPAIVDFQSFLRDTGDAVQAVLATPEAFDAFASSVLGSGASDTQKQTLKLEVETWQLRFGTLIERSLPDPAWGPSRLDAVSMIFNRLAGLDLGEPPTYLIAENIATADAPTRYPFLWNAAVQDKTQWPGFADNGNSLLALSRNLGEVYGVFAEFHPVKQSGLLRLNRDYISNNSANFEGLHALEDLIWKIGPPVWPWALDHELAAEGRAIYNRGTDQGGCVDCHGIRTGAFRSPLHRTWATPIQDVGTDSRECGVLTRTVKTGVMEGAKISFPKVIDIEIKATDTAFNLLTISVLGAILQNTLSFQAEALVAAAGTDTPELPAEFDYLSGAFRAPGTVETTALETVAGTASPRSGCAYEARVMEGIWAAAPYLHNGSVASLADLLKPVAERASSFKIGPNYDIEAIGLAADQTRFDYTLETTDCSAVDSGNSRCGHEFGTGLSASEKRALLEYLKSL